LVDLAIVTITNGDQDNVGLEFAVGNIDNGSLIVGRGLFEELVVTRIVQFDKCAE